MRKDIYQVLHRTYREQMSAKISISTDWHKSSDKFQCGQHSKAKTLTERKQGILKMFHKIEANDET
jgi:hypothetical protein